MKHHIGKSLNGQIVPFLIVSSASVGLQKRLKALLDPGYCTHTMAFSSKSNCSAVILKRSRQVLAAKCRSIPFRFS